MPLAIPQPDFEPCLALHLGAFRFLTEYEAVPHRTEQATGAAGPDDEDQDADPRQADRTGKPARA